MAEQATHWWYPIQAGTDHFFSDADGNPILDPVTGEPDTSPEAFWVSVAVNTAERFYLSSGFRTMQPGDLVWVYAGLPTQAAVGLGRASDVYYAEVEATWFVHLVWDRAVCAALQQHPIPRSEFGDLIRKPARRASPKAARVLTAWLKRHQLQSRLKPDDTEEILDPEDARVRMMKQIVMRQGQGGFRDDLLAAYGSRCAVSGCDVAAVLEAAHIRPYNGPKTNQVTNGILLRSDLHTLFDQHLLTIDDDYRIVLDPTVARGPYRRWQGQQLRLPTSKSVRPSRALLKAHRNLI